MKRTHPVLSSISVMLISTKQCSDINDVCLGTTSITSSIMIDVASKKVVNWLCVDDVCGSFLAWSLSDRCGITNW